MKKLKRTRFAEYTTSEDLELSVEKGDFILIDYVTTIKETGEVFKLKYQIREEKMLDVRC